MKKISILFALILLGAGIASCKNPLDRTEVVSFSLPSWPPDECAEFPPLAYWEIRYAGSAEAGRVIRLEAGAKTLTLEAAADRPLAVIAQPVSRHGETAALFFKPAGCIFPHERKLGWESGFAAFVCMRLYSPKGRTSGGAESANGNTVKSRQTKRRTAHTLRHSIGKNYATPLPKNLPTRNALTIRGKRIRKPSVLRSRNIRSARRSFR
nr:hypothetical protein [Treponema socranskii]